MRSVKKILALITAAAVSVCALSVTASAADNAKTAKSGKSYSTKIASNHGVSEDFKFDVVAEGTITIKFTAEASNTDIYLYGPHGTLIKADKVSMTKGSGKISNEKVTAKWKASSKKASGTITYKNAPKGIYTFRLGKGLNSTGKQKVSFTATYPASSGPSSKITGLKIMLNPGNKVKLGALVESDDAKITWTSSRESIAKVNDKGTVTALKSGLTVITAKCGITSAEIRVVVE